MQVVGNIRNIRKQNNLASKLKVDLKVNASNHLDKQFDTVIAKMGNLTHIDYVKERDSNGYSFIVDGSDFLIPFAENLDVSTEIKKLEEELNYTKGFLKSVEGKLSNERFVAGAPEQVVAVERKKANDAINTISLLEEKLKALKN